MNGWRPLRLSCACSWHGCYLPQTLCIFIFLDDNLTITVTVQCTAGTGLAQLLAILLSDNSARPAETLSGVAKQQISKYLHISVLNTTFLINSLLSTSETVFWAELLDGERPTVKAENVSQRLNSYSDCGYYLPHYPFCFHSPRQTHRINNSIAINGIVILMSVERDKWHFGLL